jgi:predicted nicotinamide N-methyase
MSDHTWDLRTTALEVNDDKHFPNFAHKHSFDLILASDVIYSAAYLFQLASTIKHFMKPSTGRCVIVSEAMRYDVFSDRFEKHVKDLGLKKVYKEQIKYKA